MVITFIPYKSSSSVLQFCCFFCSSVYKKSSPLLRACFVVQALTPSKGELLCLAVVSFHVKWWAWQVC